MKCYLCNKNEAIEKIQVTSKMAIDVCEDCKPEAEKVIAWQRKAVIK